MKKRTKLKKIRMRVLYHIPEVPERAKKRTLLQNYRDGTMTWKLGKSSRRDFGSFPGDSRSFILEKPIKFQN